nr:MAG TPA: hypothetical protein [Caudoviricetes sp.]
MCGHWNGNCCIYRSHYYDCRSFVRKIWSPGCFRFYWNRWSRFDRFNHYHRCKDTKPIIQQQNLRNFSFNPRRNSGIFLSCAQETHDYKCT